MTRRSPLRRLAAGLLAAAVLSPVSALGAENVDVSLSGVRAEGDDVTGVLTLRSTTPVRVDSASLRARLGGEDVPVSVRQDPQVRRTAMLVIDTSGSMGLEGMATVRAAVRDYLKQVPADVSVGVTSFADTAGVDLSPTRNRRAVQRVVDGLVSRGDTSLYQGMLRAAESLGKQGDRSIVLLSDGADTVARNPAAALEEAGEALARAEARVDVVRFRTDDPEATSALRMFAKSNGGALVSADDTDAVRSAFQASATALDSQAQFLLDVPETLSGTQTLLLTGSAGGTTFEFRRAVELGAAPLPDDGPADPVSPGAAAALPKAAAEPAPWIVWLAAGLVALAAMGGVWALTRPTLHTRRERRVASIASYTEQTQVGAPSQPSQRTPVTGHLIAASDRFMHGRKSTTKTLALIDRADLPFRPGEWLLIRLTSALVMVGIELLFVGASWIFFIVTGLAFAALGFAIPQLVLRFLAAKRAKAFERVLPDVLMLVATSLRSGFGLPQALDAVARDAVEPAAKEFSRALAETRIGTDVPDALDHMADRMDSTSLRWTVMAIRIQRDVGGNLADTLRTTAATLRERETLRRLVRTLSAEGRLSAYILVGLPIGLFLYLSATNREYIRLLWTDPIGMVLLAVGCLLLVVGTFWMRRVVRIEA